VVDDLVLCCDVSSSLLLQLLISSQLSQHMAQRTLGLDNNELDTFFAHRVGLGYYISLGVKEFYRHTDHKSDSPAPRGLDTEQTLPLIQPLQDLAQ